MRQLNAAYYISLYVWLVLIELPGRASVNSHILWNGPIKSRVTVLFPGLFCCPDPFPAQMILCSAASGHLTFQGRYRDNFQDPESSGFEFLPSLSRELKSEEHARLPTHIYTYTVPTAVLQISA
ncbi:hypothetical protein F5B21DRAFT_163803 [Xylaria acuta]|nr:hypothetical protein F5B21DRAFT_163803 [Xylaria acuta]